MRPTRLPRPVAIGSLLAAMLAAGGTAAQSPANKAAAEALFAEGRGLMALNRPAEACPKFAASQRLDPGLGTLLNLGDCYERIGKTASAWALFREAASLATASSDGRRAAEAQRRATALDRRLSTLTILPPTPVPAGLVVRRGTSLLESEVLGIPVPVDPGNHVIEATAPGRAPWRTRVKVGGDADRVVVQIANLGAARDPPGTGQRSAALIVGGFGVVGVLAGGVFALRATSKWQDLQSRCSGARCAPTDEQTLVHEAKTDSKVATVVFGAGVVGLATGCVLWWTAPARKGQNDSAALSITPAPGLGVAGLSLQGGF